DLERVPDRAICKRAARTLDRRRGTKSLEQGARGNSASLRRGDDERESAAHHPCGPTRAQRQAQFAESRTARATHSTALPLDGAVEVRHGRLHPTSSRSRRVAGPYDIRARHTPDHFPIHGRYPASREYVV